MFHVQYQAPISRPESRPSTQITTCHVRPSFDPNHETNHACFSPRPTLGGPLGYNVLKIRKREVVLTTRSCRRTSFVAEPPAEARAIHPRRLSHPRGTEDTTWTCKAHPRFRRRIPRTSCSSAARPRALTSRPCSWCESHRNLRAERTQPPWPTAGCASAAHPHIARIISRPWPRPALPADLC